MTRVLIIGGARFIGLAVAIQLIERGVPVAVLHRTYSTKLDPRILQITGDRRKDGGLQNPEVASQLAAFNPSLILDMIAFREEDAADLLAVIKNNLPSCERIILISSVDVYQSYGKLIRREAGLIGPGSCANPIKDDSPLRTVLYPYKDSYDKIPIEQALMTSDQVVTTVLRLPFIYGPNDMQHRFHEFLKKMKDGRPVILVDKGQLTFEKTSMFVTNTAAAIVAAILIDKKPAESKAYCIGDGQSDFTEQELIQKLADKLEWTGKVLEKQEEAEEDFNHHMVVDGSVFAREFGFVAPVSLDEALTQTIAWELENPPSDIVFDYEAEDKVIEKLLLGSDGDGVKTV
ncbi:UNVERIFIED_CONTAM: hypothetical protein HDU68_005543 [Siphonaria sp. JEL0065]|nr:hypothetical protein HDU68_005543 [Siphonaria sp. JEL0065]